jgi:hypothetical protein
VEASNFPLPTLGPVLRAVSRDLHEGKGFGVLRGINPKNYSVEDLTTIWLGLQSYIADQRGRQDKRGNMLGEHTVTQSWWRLGANQLSAHYCRQQHKAGR